MALSPCRLTAALAALGVAGGIEVVSGYASKMWEEARAMCPEGTWLEHCRTIPASKLGAYPTADARGCVATALSSPVRASAICSRSVPFAEGRPTVVVESHRQYQDGRNVVARCGDEQQFIVSCNCHSFWSQCKEASWLPGANGCVAWFGLNKNAGRRRYKEMGSGGKVFAICRALTVVGRPAAVGKTSSAFCPPGTWVYRCFGSGSVAPSEDGRSCAAASFPGVNGGFAVTVATCGPVRTWVVRQSGDFRDNAVLSTQCSHGMKAVWCACESPWGACRDGDFRPTSPFGCSTHIPLTSGVRRRRAGAKIHAICEWPEVVPSPCYAVGKGRLLAVTLGIDFTVRLCQENYVQDIQRLRNALGGAWQTQQVRQEGTFTVRMLTGGLEVLLTMQREDLYLREITVKRAGSVLRHVLLTGRKAYLPPRNGEPAEFPESYVDMPKPGKLGKRLLTDGIDEGDPERDTWLLPYAAAVAVPEAWRFEMVMVGVASLLASNGVPFFEVGEKGLLPLTKNWNAICKDQGNQVPLRLAVPVKAVKAFSEKHASLNFRMKCQPETIYATEEGSRCVERYASGGSGFTGSSARRLMTDLANATLARPLDFV